MNRRSQTLVLKLIVLVYAFSGVIINIFAQSQQVGISTVLPPVDFRALISKSDLIYNSPVSKSEEGMPVGNGAMGTLVWTTPSALHYQLNRVDVFANDESSHNFYERNTDYCGGVGFLDIDFPSYDEVFTGNDFHQKLSCYDAIVATGGKQVKTETFVWSCGDVMAIKVQDYRKGLPVVIRLRTLRPPVTNRGDHQAISVLKAEGTNQMSLTQTFSEGDYICKSAMAVAVAGAEAKAQQANDAEMTLTVKPEDSAFYVFVSSAATFDKEFDVTADALGKSAKAKSTGYDALFALHKQWWKNFWEQSMVNLSSSDGVADNITVHYNYFMYLMGSCSRGEYEMKFNGMLWTTGGDKRQWGSQFWGANQSCFYNGLFPANRPELMQPLFKMYSRMVPSLERAAVQQWGSKGIYIPETVCFNGFSELPEDIAAEMRDLYLARKPWSEVSPEFMQYAATKMPHNSRWVWKKDDGWKNGVWHFSDKGGGGFAQVNHLFSRGAKIAYQYWMQYEYSQDKDWLANHAYPMIKGVAEFYRNFPNLKKEQDGKYHIRYVNDNESVWGGHNTVEEISSIMGLFPVAIKAASILNLDADLRKSWAEVLDNLSPLTLSSDYPELAGQPVTFVRSLPPTRNELRAIKNIPDLNTMPVWFFDLLTLESTDKTMMQIANNTYNAYFKTGSGYSTQEMNGISKDIKVGILSKLPVTGAQMGRKDATRYLIPAQIRYDGGSVMRNRLDLSEGPQTTNVQRLGRVADALHNALCQSIPAKPGEETIIRVFPAWPEEWDAQFTLLCRGNFLVTSSFKKGTVEFVEIKSQAGKVCKIRNPWDTEEVTINRNGKQIQKTKANLIVFPAKQNEIFVIKKSKSNPAIQPINSIDAFQSAIEKAKPGDVITLKNGVYTTEKPIIVSCIGAKDKPVTIQAETIGGVELKGTHGFTFNNAAYLVVSGFKLTHAAGGNTVNINSHHIRITRCTFGPSDGKGYYLGLRGDDCEVDYCEFQDKNRVGNMIDIAGENGQVARRLHIHHNYFHDFRKSEVAGETNGLEVIRFGLSGLSMSYGNGLVEYNLFARCEGENELITNKSCGNTYRFNTFLDSKGAQLTLRHGNDGLAEKNYFRNTEGLRIFGDRNKVRENYFEQNTVGINIGNGDGEVADGSQLTCHDRPDHTEILNNVMINNKIAYFMGGRNNGLGATYTAFAENIIVGGETAVKIEGVYPGAVWKDNVIWKAGAIGDIPASGYKEKDPGRLSPQALGIPVLTPADVGPAAKSQ